MRSDMASVPGSENYQ